MNKELYEVLVDREEILRNYKNLQDKYYSLIKSVNLIKRQAKQETAKEIFNDLDEVHDLINGIDVIDYDIVKKKWLKKEVNDE